MFARRLCGVLLGVVVAVACRDLQAQQQDAPHEPLRCAMSAPANVTAGLLTAELHMLLQLSETFRAQCARIASDPRLRVRLSVVYAVDGGGRAQTTFHRERSGPLVADVEILFGGNYQELLAHEFEHVIEQLDGVDLRREAAAGRAWEVASGTFETRRASLVGAQVRREAAMPPAGQGLAARATR
jgi:hypothetical protein